MSNKYTKKKTPVTNEHEKKNHKLIGKIIVIVLALLMVITFSSDFFYMFN